MSSKKLGALLRSVPPATAREVDEPAPHAAPLAPPPAADPVALAPEPAPRKPSRAAPAVEPEVPLQVLIPRNIRKELAHKAAEEGESLRALMLRAIRSLGVTVTDAEIAGKRGRPKA